MKTCRFGSKFLLLTLCSLLLPIAAFANNAVVDCSGATPGAFTTITAALATLPKLPAGAALSAPAMPGATFRVVSTIGNPSD